MTRQILSKAPGTWSLKPDWCAVSGERFKHAPFQCSLHAAFRSVNRHSYLSGGYRTTPLDERLTRQPICCDGPELAVQSTWPAAFCSKNLRELKI